MYMHEKSIWSELKQSVIIDVHHGRLIKVKGYENSSDIAMSGKLFFR